MYHKRSASSKDTDLVHLDDVKKVFMTTPAWRKLWVNVECLFKLPVFKEITLLEHKKGSSIELSECMNYTTKLEIGILGLLWCTGSQKAKANFLYKLA